MEKAIALVRGMGDYIQRRLQALQWHGWGLYTPLRAFANPYEARDHVITQRGYVSNPRQGADGREQVERKPLEDVGDLLTWRGNFVLLGEPGGGKTFALEEIEHRALHAYRRGDSERLPVFLPLRRCKMEGKNARERLNGSFALPEWLRRPDRNHPRSR